MASHKNFVDYVAEQLREAGTIRSRKMFGEYTRLGFSSPIWSYQRRVRVVTPDRRDSS